MKISEVLSNLQRDENPSTRLLRNMLIETVLHVADLKSDGEVQVDLSQATVNGGWDRLSTSVQDGVYTVSLKAEQGDSSLTGLGLTPEDALEDFGDQLGAIRNPIDHLDGSQAARFTSFVQKIRQDPARLVTLLDNLSTFLNALKPGQSPAVNDDNIGPLLDVHRDLGELWAAKQST